MKKILVLMILILVSSLVVALEIDWKDKGFLEPFDDNSDTIEWGIGDLDADLPNVIDASDLPNPNEENVQSDIDNLLDIYGENLPLMGLYDQFKVEEYPILVNFTIKSISGTNTKNFCQEGPNCLSFNFFDDIGYRHKIGIVGKLDLSKDVKNQVLIFTKYPLSYTGLNLGLLGDNGDYYLYNIIKSPFYKPALTKVNNLTYQNQLQNQTYSFDILDLIFEGYLEVYSQ